MQSCALSTRLNTYLQNVAQILHNYTKSLLYDHGSSHPANRKRTLEILFGRNLPKLILKGKC